MMYFKYKAVNYLLVCVCVCKQFCKQLWIIMLLSLIHWGYQMIVVSHESQPSFHNTTTITHAVNIVLSNLDVHTNLYFSCSFHWNCLELNWLPRMSLCPLTLLIGLQFWQTELGHNWLPEDQLKYHLTLYSIKTTVMEEVATIIISGSRWLVVRI